MSTNHDVRVGQVWADNDPRISKHSPRLLRVERIDENGSSQNGHPHAECVLVERLTDGAGQPTGWARRTTRISRIRLARFKPTQTGYRLVEDVQP